MKIIAHRGLYDKVVAENTYLAISRALNNNSLVGVEIDVRLTKDNKIVVIHDKNISRTSNGFGIVENMTLSELQKYNFGSKKFYQTIPTLDKVLDIRTSKIILIEIKINRNVNNFYKSLITILEKYKNKNIYLMSFNKNIINKLRKKFKYYKVGFIYLTNKINYNYKNDFYVINHNFINKKQINTLFKKNKKVFFWTLNKFNELQKINSQIKNIDAYYICSVYKIKHYLHN